MRMPGARRGTALGVSLLVLVLASGCGDDDDDDRGHDGAQGDAGTARLLCGPVGVSVACTGPGGCDGAQECRSDGSYGACDCGADAPSRCAPAGILVTCVGDGECSGHQACGTDGAFGICECADATAGSITALEITSPAPGDAVSRTLEMEGTAGGDVDVVAVAVGDGPLLVADGTNSWSFSFDVSHLVGATTVRVVATGEDGGELQRWLQVRVVDPLVGTWSRTVPGCVLIFGENSALDATGCRWGALQSFIPSRAKSWRRTSGDVIAIDRGYGDTAQVIAIVSDDGEMLTLSRDPSLVETYVRGTPDFGSDGGTD